MNDKDMSGPAFPTTLTGPWEVFGLKADETQKIEFHGMTLRDYFAAKAMQAAATNPKGADGFTFKQRAEWAYQQADAMLEARK